MIRHGLLLAVVTVSTALGACASAPPQPIPQPPAPVAGDLDLPGAVYAIVDDLARQARTTTNRTAVVDTFVDRATGQQTDATARFEQTLAPALSASVQRLTVAPFDSAGAGRAEWVVTGTLATSESGQYTANVAITDRTSGIVLAQSVARFRDADNGTTPTRFYGDSPTVGRDRSVDGLVTTSETPAGRAADPLYIEQLPTAAVLKEALDAYNTERWQDALTLYTAAAARPDGQQVRTFNGVYLANLRLGRLPAAEEAFGRIVAFGLATSGLAVKVLFETGTTTFTAGADLAGVYPIWIRQIARGAQTARACLNVVGHTSRSGSEEVNDRLSRARADAVRVLLEREVPGLAGQLTATGVGFRENIVGTGVDNASDAVDRRVEFKVIPCPAR